MPPTRGDHALLELREVSVAFGGLQALDGISLTVRRGEILGLIGPNGSGKSTTFDVISGVVSPDAGRVVFDGADITGLAPHQIAHRGIGRTFQVGRPFPRLTALENVLAGHLFGSTGGRRSPEAIEQSRAVLQQVGLGARADEKVGAFTVLERKWLEVGRALAGRPRVVLLDEFMAGISPQQLPATIELVKAINDSGVTVVIVEHIVKAITGACDRVIVLDAGKKLAEGTVGEIVENPFVIEAYLGAHHAGG